MSNTLFILALCLPPTVVVLGFLALLLPVRTVTHAPKAAPVRPESGARTMTTPARHRRLLAHPLSH